VLKKIRGGDNSIDYNIERMQKMQNIKNKEGDSIKGIRGGESRVSRRKERASSAPVMELCAEKKGKEEEEGKKRTR